MLSSSSELLLDRQQQELRKRKLLELAQPKKPKAPRRTCRQAAWFYATSFLAATSVGGGAALLFLVPLYVDPAISTLRADFAPHPVRCVTTRREDLTGIFNCTWSSCREGCTSDMFFCLHVFVTYDTRPYNASSATVTPATATTPPATTTGSWGGENATEEAQEGEESSTEFAADVTEEAVLYDNIKGCGYPPEVDCDRFAKAYGTPGTAFPCYYSRENRSVVMTSYDRDRQVAVILHFFAVPFVVTLAASALLCAMHCDCSCSDGRDRRRRRRRSTVEDSRHFMNCPVESCGCDNYSYRPKFPGGPGGDASDYSISTRVDVLTPHSEATRPL